MKNIGFAMSGALVLGLVFTALSQVDKPSPPSASDKQVAELTKQVRSLQEKIKTLEERLDRLEKVKNTASAVSPPLVIPPALGHQRSIQGYFADPNHPPKIWGEGECNGWKYYVIPLSGHEMVSGNRIAPAIANGMPGPSE